MNLLEFRTSFLIDGKVFLKYKQIYYTIDRNSIDLKSNYTEQINLSDFANQFEQHHPNYVGVKQQIVV